VEKKKILLAPIDPVHDVGIKMINRGLAEAGHETILLPPDLPPDEIIQTALEKNVNVVMLSRTLGYGVAELLAKFIDYTEAAGLRDKAKIAIGGMAIRPELAQELGFDAGFGPGTTIEEALAFVEGRDFLKGGAGIAKSKKNITLGYSYEVKHSAIRRLLDEITAMILNWAEGKTSPGVERAKVRDELWDVKRWRAGEDLPEFRNEYSKLCEDSIREFYEKGNLHPKTRALTQADVSKLNDFLGSCKARMSVTNLRHALEKPLVFNQYGTGCPFMDIAHIKVCEAWGADGVIHFDPSWGARAEGFYDGLLTHSEDGTVMTAANLECIHNSLEAGTTWQVRAHRGLNTPETAVLAGKIGADMTKINICYGSLGAGTDPERMTVDGLATTRYAAKYNMPFDVVTNEELCGVPAFKAFAGMLIVARVGLELSGKPILQPLFCFSPEVMVSRQMDDNYVDFNTAKILALRLIIDAPIWPGAPIGFLTQTQDRVQSSAATSYHGSLAAMLGVDAISIASSDEAYSGGPISAPARIDTLRALAEGFRFFGSYQAKVSEQAVRWADELVLGIESVLKEVVRHGDFVKALYDGVLGSKEDGAYPGRGGRNTVY
jgi:methylmalonyl-CoA mutase cobalamin-binding domain/chain